MAKRKLFWFYRQDETRRNILNYISIAFLALLSLRMFFCLSFFTLSPLMQSLISGGMSVFVLLLLFFLLPDLNDGLFFLWLGFLLALDISYVTHFTGLEYICNTIIFLGTLTLLPHIRLKENTVKLFSVLFLFYSFLIVLFANRGYSQKALIELNPNTSSFICFLSIVLLLVWGSKSQNPVKTVCYILAGVWLLFQIPFMGRSSLLGVALFFGYFVLRKFFNKTPPKAAKWIMIILSIFAVVFAYLYAKPLFQWIGKGKLILFGKDLFTGRQVIWEGAFDRLKDSWLFGIGNTLDTEIIVSTQAESDNLHNQIMGYLTCFGVFVAVMYIVVLAALTMRVYRCGKMTGAFIIALLVLSYFETILYSTGTMICLPIILILIYHLDCKGGKTQMVIHYCWLGGGKKSPKLEYCIRSWKRLYPDIQIIEWNESNYDVHKNPYIAQAYEQKKYAFVSDYMRFDILHRYGGVYLDTDVELLKDITPLIKDSFLGFESKTGVAPGLIMCANGGEPFLKEVLDYYDGMEKFSMDETVVQITTKLLVKHGLKLDGTKQTVAGFIIYPTEFFNPKGGEYGKEKITENTYSIHHYEASWKSVLDQKIMRYKVKYGNKKGRLLFALRHPILALKKAREKK